MKDLFKSNPMGFILATCVISILVCLTVCGMAYVVACTADSIHKLSNPVKESNEQHPVHPDSSKLEVEEPSKAP